MGHGKETPRQKMIGMMYLVLTALLALNVQKEVLDAFVIVDDGISKMNENYSDKNSMMYAAFDQAYAENQNKAGRWRDIALEVKKRTDDLYQMIQDQKLEIVDLAEDDETKAIVGRNIIPKEISAKDNADKPAEVMIVKGGGKKLRKAIEEYRSYLVSHIDPKAEGVKLSIEKGLDTSDPPSKDGKTESWESEHFESLPLVGVTTIMTGLQSNIRNAESDILRYLYTMIDKGTFKFTNLESTVIHNSNYIIQGSEYKASVFIAAFDTTQDPSIYLGPYDSTRNDDGSFSYSLKPGYKYDSIPVKNGKGEYIVKGSKVGQVKWGGVIKLKTPDGGQDFLRPFKAEYQVVEPMLVVSPTKMNVFYLGVDNPVEISVPSVGSDKIFPTISNGVIKKDGKGYIVVPKSLGQNAVITVMAEIDKVKRNMGEKPFRVRMVPNPVAMVGGQKGGMIAKAVLLAQAGVIAEMENFEFDLKFTVTEFVVSVNVGGFSNDKLSKSNRFTDEQMALMKQANRGQKVYIENVKAVGPDGSTRLLGTIAFTIK